MDEKIIEMKGERGGPSSVVLVGVHGDETPPLRAMEAILPSLKIRRGRVFFAVGNPGALELARRCVDADLNRLFLPESLLTEKQKKSYEYQRVKILRKYLDRADALLDLHTSSVKGTPPFVICEDNAEEIACFLPANLLVSGFDRLEPGGTDWYMNKRGNIGICLECGHSADSESAKTAARGIFAFLKLRGHIDGGHLRRREQLQIEVYRKHISRRSFFPAKNFKNFQRVEKGELIGRDGDEVIKASRESLILFAHTCREKGQDAFLLAKKKKPRQV